MSWRGLVFGVICAAWLAASPVAAFLALMTPRLAQGGAEGGLGVGVWVLMITFFTLPAACVLAPVAAIVAYRKGGRGLAWGLAALPLAWVVTPAVVWSVI